MIRTSFFQHDDQRKRIAKAAKKLKITAAEFMRRAINEALTRSGF